MPYNEDLNKKLDATIEGQKIKRQFDLSISYVQKLLQFAKEPLNETGELKSVVLTSFTPEEQTEIKTYLSAIKDAGSEFLDKMNMINNPKNIEVIDE